MPEPLGSRYLLEAEIGRGGMGVVWLGSDRLTGDRYAIKVIRPELVRDDKVVARFVQERTVLTQIRHPNMVAVHDMIVEGDRLALVMDLVEGHDLAVHRERSGGTLPPAEAAALTAQVCDALTAAHEAGIVHRDVKPSNVLLAVADTVSPVRLADFGIAHVTEGTRITSTNIFVGTPSYLAPEIITGGVPGPAADVYAVGMTLYELLLGRAPFAGPHPAALLHGHLYTRLHHLPGLPGELWPLIEACVAKDPAARPSAARAAELLRAALPALAGSPAAPALAEGAVTGETPPMPWQAGLPATADPAPPFIAAVPFDPATPFPADAFTAPAFPAAAPTPPARPADPAGTPVPPGAFGAVPASPGFSASTPALPGFSGAVPASPGFSAGMPASPGGLGGGPMWAGGSGTTPMGAADLGTAPPGPGGAGVPAVGFGGTAVPPGGGGRRRVVAIAGGVAACLAVAGIAVAAAVLVPGPGRGGGPAEAAGTRPAAATAAPESEPAAATAAPGAKGSGPGRSPAPSRTATPKARHKTASPTPAATSGWCGQIKVLSDGTALTSCFSTDHVGFTIRGFAANQPAGKHYQIRLLLKDANQADLAKYTGGVCPASGVCDYRVSVPRSLLTPGHQYTVLPQRLVNGNWVSGDTDGSEPGLLTY